MSKASEGEIEIELSEKQLKAFGLKKGEVRAFRLKEGWVYDDNGNPVPKTTK